jgi:hypothetical protein
VSEHHPYQDGAALTLDAVRREITSLDQRIAVRLDGIDKATEVFQANLTRVPTEVDKAVSHAKSLHSAELSGLRELVMEKFQGIGTQIKERDTQSERTARDIKAAVDAAFAAAKEAVGEQNKSNALANQKNEANFTKQLDALGDLVRTMTGGLNDKIDDAKARLTAIESKGAGKDQGLAIGWVVFAVLAGLAISGIGIVVAFKSGSTPAAPQIVYLPAPAVAAAPKP